MSMPATSLPATPNLAELLQGLALAPPLPLADIASDNRRITAGSLFLACRGASAHALDYLEPPQLAKIAAIAWDGDSNATLPDNIPAVVVPDLRSHFGRIANRWFDNPSAALRVAGITGTNGKTTVAWLLAQCWQILGRKSAYIGTLGAGMNDIADTGGLTTPDCIELHRQLAGFRDAGAGEVAIEASSHGISQGRLDGVTLSTALFTNLSRDHIDFHGDMAAYGEAKARLFTDYAAKLQVVCIDSEFGRTLAGRCGDEAVLVASDMQHDAGPNPYVFADNVQATVAGSRLEIRSSFGNARCQLPLFGQFNVANALQAIAALLGDGVEFEDAIELLQLVTPPPGRMEQVQVADSDNVPAVFVDYAHTPAALESALQALRPHCNGRLWCVFGCGGDRDAGKRPLMGKAVQQFADNPVLTSDNPRSEDPVAIMRDVERGMRGDVVAIEDRATAIAWAIRSAAADDIVLIAGKGHEDYQLLGGKRLSFSDHEVAARYLRQRAAT